MFQYQLIIWLNNSFLLNILTFSLQQDLIPFQRKESFSNQKKNPSWSGRFTGWCTGTNLQSGICLEKYYTARVISYVRSNVYFKPSAYLELSIYRYCPEIEFLYNSFGYLLITWWNSETLFCIDILFCERYRKQWHTGMVGERETIHNRFDCLFNRRKSSNFGRAIYMNNCDPYQFQKDTGKPFFNQERRGYSKKTQSLPHFLFTPKKYLYIQFQYLLCYKKNKERTWGSVHLSHTQRSTMKKLNLNHHLEECLWWE